METGVEREQEPDRFAPAIDVATRLLNNIETVVYGKREEVKLVLAALMCGGHVLLEDVPGTAKTVLARAIGGSIDGVTISRIQCTPDLQPTDVTGMSVFDQKTRDFEFRPGPIFTNVLLVDEINRATPKTQSALLEAMAEGQVTVDGVTMQLPSPFFLLATDNPIEYEGTFPLPEAQLDRFLLRTALGYPGVLEERRILEEQRYRHPLGELQPAVTLADIRELRDAAQHVYVDEVLHNWIVDLVRATRELEVVSIGSSVRGSLAVERVARAWALLNGRGYVIPEDVERLFVPVLVHRVVFTPALVARARAAGWPAAIEEFRQACLELAPRPGSDEDPALPRADRPDRDLSSGQQTFQLVPRRRLLGLPHGTMRSVRRGRGTEVAGSRPYRPGDDIRTIDWASSARLSSARGRDEFVVRERYADEGPRVVVVCDRSPQLAFFGPPLPWLHKGTAMRRAVELVLASATSSGGFGGYLDYADGEPFWLPPRGERRIAHLREERLDSAGWSAPADGVQRSLEHLFEHRRNVPGRQFRLRPLRLPPATHPGDLAHGVRAPLGRGAGRDSGSDLGAELPGSQRHRCPAARSGDASRRQCPPDEEGGCRPPPRERGAVPRPPGRAPAARPRSDRRLVQRPGGAPCLVPRLERAPARAAGSGVAG